MYHISWVGKTKNWNVIMSQFWDWHNQTLLFYVLTLKKVLVKNQESPLKVSKSQKHFFLKLHCPKNEQNICQNSALASYGIFFSNILFVFWAMELQENYFWDLLIFKKTSFWILLAIRGFWVASLDSKKWWWIEVLNERFW